MPVPSFDATGGHDQAAFGRVERSGHFSIHLISWNQTMVEASARSSAGCDAALMSKSTVGILLAQLALLIHSYRSRESGSDSTCDRMSYPGARSRTWIVIGFLTLVGTHSLGCSLSGEEAEALRLLFSRAVIVV